MYEALLTEINESAVSVEVRTNELRETHRVFASENGAFPVDRNLPGTDFDLATFLGAASALAAITAKLTVKDGGAFVPKAYLEALRDRLKEFDSSLEGANSQFRAVADQGGFASFDEANFIVTSKSGNGINVAKPIRSAFARMDAAYAAWYQLRLVVRTPQLKELSNILRLGEAQTGKIADLAEIAAKSTDGIKSLSGEISKWHERADENLLEINRILKAVQSERKSIDENAATAAAKLAELTTVESSAAEISASIRAHKSVFDQFDEEAKLRTALFETQKMQYEQLKGELTEAKERANTLIDDSENLLRGATNAGLAASFSRLQKTIGWELFFAGWSFYVSIALLVLLTFPIAIYVFPGLQMLLKQVTGMSFDPLLPKSMADHSSFETIAQIAARGLLLVPGIWLVRFAAARHERLFRLREHYAFKYSVASSVEGFKQQAPEMKDAIAAAAFFELTFNPATRMDVGSTEARYPNPIMDWVMQKLQKKPAPTQ
ncbi:hypothetical protein [Bradyrhizobium glycinis]|uniref:hypothetical protein n=1 Tax=Bradyrhizobium glycinis TaxID=2751812 RepID=UPI0018D9BBB7|nr:hypothetical protein [Bradyrhizobium glycinis]MBH5371466.1 hypothetical protein [Bradyrhizobium glycinis]